MKVLFTKAQVDHFIESLSLRERVEEKHCISKIRVRHRCLQITRSGDRTESEPSRVVTGLEVDGEGKPAKYNLRRPITYLKLKTAFQWLLTERLVAPTIFTSVFFRVKINERAEVVNAQFRQFHFTPWLNLREKDRHLALKVVTEEYGAEVCDYLQDHYGLEVR